MRNLLVVGAVLVSATAFADPNPKAIEKAVKTNIVELGKLSDDDKLAITKDALIINPRGMPIDLTERDGCVAGAIANALYGCLQGDIKHVPGAVTTGVAGEVGWFQAPFVAHVAGEDPDGNAVKSKTAMRAGGIAIKDVGKTWRIAALMYVEPIPDKELFKRRERDTPKGDPTLTGDAKLAGVVAGWFKTGFAGNAAKQGTLIASGTAPHEYKTAAAATKLVAGWDKLKIVATSVDAKLLAGGKIGWVTAEVRLPRKNGKSFAMRLAVIVIPDGDGWRWVSVMYQPPSFIG